MAPSFGYNDGILLVSLVYSSIDIQYEWGSFETCRHPIHWWLLVSYVCVILFRAMHVLGMQTVGTGHFLLDLRQKGKMARTIASFLWLVALPFFVVWTGLGTYWLVEILQYTPQCVPTGSHLWFTVLWLGLSYLWIFIHVALGAVAWVLERRIRRAECELREIERPDMVERWGQVSRISGYQDLSSQGHGLTPAEINALPAISAATHKLDVGLIGEELECSICLNELCSEDTVRTLNTCKHTFHRACIDLWLLRSADCPLCKRAVKGCCDVDEQSCRQRSAESLGSPNRIMV